MNKIKLSTPISIPQAEKIFTDKSVITGIGSCFAQYIIEHFHELGFNTAQNPNGIVYNAVSIAKSLDHIANNKEYDDTCFSKYNNLWYSWEHHGSFSDTKEKLLRKNIASSMSDFRKKLAKADVFILTPSSSVVYCLKSTDSVVANCHKYPEKYFYKKVLSPTDNLAALSESIENIKKINQNCQIIITLSPVRHYPGDLILNARSKANLLSAIHLCLDKFDNVDYFPSYEILLDELRDYRFFKEDMLHPTDLARKFIFQKFISTHFTTDTQKILIQREKQLKSKQHIIVS